MLKKFFLTLLIILSLSGCRDKTLLANLTEKQGVEIVSALAEIGIAGSMERSTDGSTELVSVTVSQEDYISAIQNIKQRNLPSPAELNFHDVIGDKGFLPEGAELRSLRLDRAEAAEIEELISHIPGINKVHVVVRRRVIVSKDNLSKGTVAAVIIPVSEISENEPAMLLLKQSIEDIIKKSLVTSDVELSVTVAPGMAGTKAQSNQNIVGTFRTNLTTQYIPFDKFLFFWRVATGDSTGLAVACLGTIVLSIILGFLLGTSSKSRKESKQIKIDNSNGNNGVHNTTILSRKDLEGFKK